MGILDRLRPIARWKHPDPMVRVAAAAELGADHQDTVASLARDDGDARVRRAAVVRLESIGVLGDVATSDPDDDVRAEAIRALAGIAAETTAVPRALEAVAVLAGLNRHRELVAIARDSTSAEVRLHVIASLADQKSLSAVARQAEDGHTRLQALAKLIDADELMAVALKSEHTDVAVGALERVVDEEALVAISQRARNKVAARRARARVRSAETAAAAMLVSEAPKMSAADRARAGALIAQAEGLVAVPNPAEAAAALSGARLAWAELNADAELDEALTQEFDNACEAVREAIGEREREHEGERERALAISRRQADRVAICEALEHLAGAQDEDQAAELKVRWDGLDPMPSEYAASLTRRFQDACRLFDARVRRGRLAESASVRLESLATEVESLLAAGQSLEETLSRWRGIRRDAEELREFAEANPAAAERLAQSLVALEGKEQEHERVRAKREGENLRHLQQLCRQVETLVTAETFTLKVGDKALRDIKAALETRLPLPTKQDRLDVQHRLEAARAALGPRVQQLRDADEWQRWANLQVQEELCKAMEQLKGDDDLDQATRRMRELQARWKEVALAPRAQGEALWRRFKAAQDDVYGRASAHLTAQHEARAANLARKLALCEQAESLADSTDWVKTASAIQALQAEWKAIGPVARGHEKATWERFRKACDHFFTRRQEDLKHRKEDWAANLAKKEALCERAEALASSTDWDATATTLRALQGEWKTIGPVRRAKSEAVWLRFRGACDTFFERYKHRDQVDLLAKATPREDVIKRLATLASAPEDVGEPPEGLYTLVQQARSDWQHAPELPRAVQQDMAVRYHQALGQLVARWASAFVGTDLDPEATRQRMERLVSRVEELVAAKPAPPPDLSPTELLAQQWRERLAANTIRGAATRTADNDDAQWRAADQEVRSVQAQWMRLGPVPPDVAGPLNERFQRACRRFFDGRRRAS